MSSDSIDPRWRRVAEEAARAAGRVAVAARGRVTVSSKGLRDVVTEADYAAQAAVKGIIGAAFPDHAFLAEEKDATPGGASDLTWVIDPIDGTTNYSHGVPLFCTSIALTRGGESLVGVVYDPLRDEMYAAVKGQGATLNGVSIQVSERDRLIDAIAGIEWASPQALRVDSLRRLAPLGERVMTMRSPGAAALSLAYVALGCFDLYFNVHLQPWDTAAAALMIREAGGRVTGLRGEPWRLDSGGILASNGRLHDAALGVWGISPSTSP